MFLRYILTAVGLIALTQATTVPQSEASKIEARQGCTPGRFACGIAGDIGRYVWICNSLRDWQVSAECGNSRCCRQGPQAGTAYCVC